MSSFLHFVKFQHTIQTTAFGLAHWVSVGSALEKAWRAEIHAKQGESIFS